jgi:hypothetical protein
MNNNPVSEDLIADTPVETPVEESHYFRIAMPLLKKGFTVYPMHGENDKAGDEGWNRVSRLAEYADETTQRMLARKHPDRNVAVIGRNRIGDFMFLDIDGQGVVEKLERETGKTIPSTYTVCSRPQTAPWKRHFYFRHTAYSITKWKRDNINVRDITRLEPDKNGNLVHPTLFDLKGTGRGGLVVGAGSVRASGEVYTCIDDAPVIDAPDWLIDWLAKEVTRWNSDIQKERQARAKEVAALTKGEKAALQQVGDPSGFEYPASEIFSFAYWRACILASNVVNKKYIMKQIIDDINERCAGGREYLSNPENKKKIHAMVFSSKIKMGTLRYGLLSPKNKSKYTMVGSVIIGPKPKRTRHSILVACMQRFPNSVTQEEGYQRLRKALAGTDHKLSTTTKTERKAAQKAVAQARGEAGFEARQTTEGWLWVRKVTL